MPNKSGLSSQISEKKGILSKIISEYEVAFSITLDEMYGVFNRLIFDSTSVTSATDLFKSIPEEYKSDYYKYLVDTFENNTPEHEFVNFGVASVLRKYSQTSEEKNEVASEIHNIRQFLISYK